MTYIAVVSYKKGNMNYYYYTVHAFIPCFIYVIGIQAAYKKSIQIF